jgi:hypothetical protein
VKVFKETVSGDVFVFSDFIMYSRNDYLLSQNKKSKSFIPKKKKKRYTCISVYGFLTRNYGYTVITVIFFTIIIVLFFLVDNNYY